MSSPGSSRTRATSSFPRALVGACSLIGLLASNAIAAPSTTPPASPPTASVARGVVKRPQIAKTQVAWRKSLLQLERPAEGCYESSFPRVEWRPVACGEAPKYPMPPARGMAKHFVVGGGGSNDFAANPTGTISAVEGTFPSISAGLTESGPIANSGSNIANTYTLQINTNQFTSSACAGSPNPDCKGWEQFVYENNNVSHRAFIQYWLIRFNTTCPAGGWQQFSFAGDTDIYCFQSTSTASLPAGVPVSDFGTLSMGAAVTSSSDQVTVTADANAVTRVGVNAVAAAAGWTDAEFNVFGDGGNSSGGGQAGFGANSTMVVKTTVHNGTRNAPACQAESFTGETNNLTLVGMNPIPTQASPAIEFTQSNIPGTPAACVTADGIGDTHLNTFGGLLYDFQASGDFVLAETGKEFVVQARQVSGAPTWPNATVNKAVATRMGDTRVAVCTAPARIAVDGDVREIGDQQVLSLPTGVDIQRVGNTYVIIDQKGNSLRAVVSDSHIDATVGLGRWPTEVHGLLANGKGKVNQIEARDGAMFSSPFAFDDLYHRFGDSWRVSPRESVLSDCGEPGERGIPDRPFYSKDLDPQLARHARAVCMEYGVKDRNLLEACTLDVAVIGKEDAAKVFVNLRKPIAIGRVKAPRGGKYEGGGRAK